MDSLPLEMLEKVFQWLQYHEKHVVKQVNRICKGAATNSIRNHKRLVLYPDDAADAGMCMKSLSLFNNSFKSQLNVTSMA